MLRAERQSARMSEIKNGGLDQYGAEPFKQQQFETAGVEGVKTTGKQCINNLEYHLPHLHHLPQQQQQSAVASEEDQSHQCN